YDTNFTWVTNMVTPYGTNSFAITGGTTNYVGTAQVVNRSVLITEPNGGQQLYLYRDDSGFVGGGFVPSSYSDFPDASTMLPEPYSLLDNIYVQYRNTWQWNRQQFAGLWDFGKTNVSSLISNDYRLLFL